MYYIVNFVTVFQIFRCKIRPGDTRIFEIRVSPCTRDLFGVISQFDRMGPLTSFFRQHAPAREETTTCPGDEAEVFRVVVMGGAENALIVGSSRVGI